MVTFCTYAPLGWNPRYVAYARAHGRSPEDQLAADREAMPGGSMAEFSIWITQRWAEWDQAHFGWPKPSALFTEAEIRRLRQDQAAFDRWLDLWMPAGT